MPHVKATLRRSIGIASSATSALTVLACASGTAQSARPAAPVVCTAHEAERFRLRDSTGQYYIEPRFLVESAGRMLLAGKHSYRFSADTAEPELVGRDDFFGAVVRGRGDFDIVPDPPGGAKLKPVAAAALAEGGWGFIYLEFDRNADTLEWVLSADTSGAVQRIWYAEYREGEWRAPTPLPLGEAARLDELNGTPLVISGDTAMWAVPATSRDSGTYAAVFERIGGVWTQRAVERAPYLPITYAVLTHTPTYGFLLGLVRVDTSLPGFNQNSLFVYLRDPEWRRVRGVIAGGIEPIHHPRMIRNGGDSVAVGWLAFGEAQEGRALIGDIMSGSPATHRLTGFSFDEPLPLTSVGGVYWVVDALAENRAVALMQIRGSAVHTLWRTPTPFNGYFGVAASGTNQILISGPDFEPGRLLVTLLIRLSLACSNE
jgi:hypothetical protein